jgi:cyclophilin family peptidyl-prolyl cis-trans isomerase
MANPQRPRVFLDINIGEQPAGRLTIELFTDFTPKTCDKCVQFRRLPQQDADILPAFVSYAPANTMACHMPKRPYTESSMSS